MLIAEKWDRIAIALAKNHPPEMVRVLRHAYYHGAILGVGSLAETVQAGAFTADSYPLLMALAEELLEFKAEKGEFG